MFKYYYSVMKKDDFYVPMAFVQVKEKDKLIAINLINLNNYRPSIPEALFTSGVEELEIQDNEELLKEGWREISHNDAPSNAVIVMNNHYYYITMIKIIMDFLSILSDYKRREIESTFVNKINTCFNKEGKSVKIK